MIIKLALASILLTKPQIPEETLVQNMAKAKVSGEFKRIIVRDSPGLNLVGVEFESVDIDENSPGVVIDGFTATVSGEEGILTRSAGCRFLNGQMSIKPGTTATDDFIEFRPVRYPDQWRAAWPEVENYVFGEPPNRNLDWLWYSTKTTAGQELWYGIDHRMMVDGGTVENVKFDGRGARTRAGIFSDYVKGGRFRNLEFIGFADQGITVERNIRTTVSDCDFKDGVPETSGGGLGFLNYGFGNIVKDCRFYNAPLVVAPISQPQLDLKVEGVTIRGRNLWVKYPGAVWLDASFKDVDIQGGGYFLVDVNRSPVFAKMSLADIKVAGATTGRTIWLSQTEATVDRAWLSGSLPLYDFNARGEMSKVTMRGVLYNGNEQASAKIARAVVPVDE